MIQKKHSDVREHQRNTTAIIFYTGSCKPIDRFFFRFVGECIAWKLDYKNDRVLMKFKNNSKTRWGNSSNNFLYTVGL